MTVIKNSVAIARTIAKELRASGLSTTEKKLGSGISAQATKFNEGAWRHGVSKMRNGDFFIDVEERVIAGPHANALKSRDVFVLRNGKKKPKFVSTQLASATGNAYIFPGKKGFLGLGKRKPSIDISQCRDQATHYLGKDCENMRLIASGTLENPQNPVLYAEGRQFLLTLENAKKFIQDVLEGKITELSRYKVW